MATGYQSREDRQKILEGLWLIGIEPTQLNVSADLQGQAFLDALHANGVHDEFIGRAIRGVDWRAESEGSAPLYQKVAALLRTSGYRQDEVDRFYNDARRDGNNPQFVMDLLTRDFNDRTAGAMIYKATGGKAPQGAIWNPFRGDVPPREVDTRFGSVGVLTVPGPVNELPQGPTPVQQKQQAAKAPPGPPTVSGATPGPTGAPGAGAGAGGGGGYTPPPVKPVTPEERRANLQGRYGWAAALLDDPEVARIVGDVMSGQISEAEADRRWKSSNFYKTTAANERAWLILEKSDPADAAQQLQAQIDSITSRAMTQGVRLDPERARQIALASKKNGWSDQMINQALASEIAWDPKGAKTGTLAQIKAAQQSQLVPLSDQAMTQWSQAIVGGTRTIEDFQAYLKDQAKSLFPTISTSLDSMTVRQYLDPYEQTIKKTLGETTQVDWSDPKWFRFVNSNDDKGQRQVMSIADMQRTLVTDGQYGYDRTENGKQAKASLAQTIMEDFGFMSAGGR